MAWGAPGNTAVKIGLHVPNFGAFADPGTVADLAAFPVGLTARQLPALIGEIARLRGGLHGYDVVAGGTDDWQEWRDAGATWWLRVLPWSRPIDESARTVESGPPGR
jgi:hypothetical protein